jgi:uncharacterized protein (DUF305 family)
MLTRSLSAFILCAAPAVALAQSYASHDMHQMALNGAGEVQGFKPTGDMDRDFAVMMRHHQKIAVRMAEHEMQHGKDPKVKELARRIVETQTKESKELEAWLDSRAKK